MVIVDEIHLLDEERGPILECLIARTLRHIERTQRTVRLVGLSATLPNYIDVAVFLQVRKECLFYFNHSFRPVPLLQRFVGIKEPSMLMARTKDRKKQDVYNEQCYEVSKNILKNHKQVLIFVHSRKDT